MYNTCNLKRFFLIHKTPRYQLYDFWTTVSDYVYNYNRTKNPRIDLKRILEMSSMTIND